MDRSTDGRPGNELLRAWRLAEGLSQGAAAQRLDVRQATWCEWEGDERFRGPSRDMAIRLEALTEGAVPIESWSADPQLADDMKTLIAGRLEWLRELAGILAMRTKADVRSIATRARAEIERLRALEKMPPTEMQFDALDERLDRTAREHETAIAAVRRARALLRGLREQLETVDAEVTRSHRYRMEMEVFAE